VVGQHRHATSRSRTWPEQHAACSILGLAQDDVGRVAKHGRTMNRAGPGDRSDRPDRDSAAALGRQKNISFEDLDDEWLTR